MGLAPAAFWSLTVREFYIKHAAFARSEDRQLALVIDLALRTGEYKPSDRTQMEQAMHALRRYPVKQWTVMADG